MNFAILKGKKTYVLGFVSIVGAVGGVLVGDLSLGDGVQLIVTAALGMTLRNGIGG